MDLNALIKDCQRTVGVEDDGRPGVATWTAIWKKLCEPDITISPEAISSADIVDERSERTIATLLPHVRPYARALIHAARDRGITIKAISGNRTIEEQDKLFRQCCDGRDNDGDGQIDEPDERVTKARGGYSNHNFGLAFDIGIFDGTKYIPESKLYAVVGAIGMGIGLDWGGNWTSIKDEPHFQLRPTWAKGMSEGAMLAELRSGRSPI